MTEVADDMGQITLVPPLKGAELRSMSQVNLALHAVGSTTWVVLYVGASWCKPCKTLKPQFESWIKVHGDRTDLWMCTVDVDIVPEIQEQLGIRKLPTVLVLQNKVVHTRFIGGTECLQLDAWLNNCQIPQVVPPTTSINLTCATE